MSTQSLSRWNKSVLQAYVVSSHANKSDNRSIKMYGVNKKEHNMMVEQGRKLEGRFKKQNKARAIIPVPLDPTIKKDGDFMDKNPDSGQWFELQVNVVDSVSINGQDSNLVSLGVEIGCGKTFCKAVVADMKSSGLYFEILERVGYRSNDSWKTTIVLQFRKWWNTSNENYTCVKELWLVLKPPKAKWKSDMLWVYPNELFVFNIYMSRLYGYGIATILDTICKLTDKPQCTILSLGFIVMSCTPNDGNTEPFFHTDFGSTLQQMYTVIIPLELPSVVEPELKFECTFKRGQEPKRFSYRYQDNTALAFPGGVRHATNRVGQMTRDVRIMMTMFVGTFDDEPATLYDEVSKCLWMPFFGRDSSKRFIKNWRDIMSHKVGDKVWVHKQ